jgi:hypothetical protein
MLKEENELFDRRHHNNEVVPEKRSDWVVTISAEKNVLNTKKIIYIAIYAFSTTYDRFAALKCDITRFLYGGGKACCAPRHL